MGKLVWILAVPLVVGAYVVGLKQGQGESGGQAFAVTSRPGTPVATFNGQSISAEELKAQIEEQTSFVRVRYANLEGKKEYLQGISRFELLSAEAQRRGFDRDPEVLRQHKKSAVALFMQKEFEEAQQKLPIADADLQKFYEDHLEDYVKPERVRIAHIFLEAPLTDAALREKKKHAAEAALAEVKEKNADYMAFGNIARLRSEDPQSRPISGDLHYLSREQMSERVGKPVADVAFEMRDNGSFHDGIIETDQGFHVIKLGGRESALNLKFEEVREAIRNRLHYERRAQNYNQFIEGLEKKAGLTIDEKALEAIVIDLGAPTPVTTPNLPLPPASARRAQESPAPSAHP